MVRILEKKRKHLKIVITNPEEIPNARKRFTELFCELHKEEILKVIEKMQQNKR